MRSAIVDCVEHDGRQGASGKCFGLWRGMAAQCGACFWEVGNGGHRCDEGIVYVRAKRSSGITKKGECHQLLSSRGGLRPVVCDSGEVPFFKSLFFQVPFFSSPFF